MKPPLFNGYEKEIHNFQTLLSVVVNLDSEYKPVQKAIDLDALNRLLASAQLSLNRLCDAYLSYLEVQSRCSALSEYIVKRSASFLAALEYMKVSEENLNEAKRLLRTIVANAVDQKAGMIGSSLKEKCLLLDHFNQLVDFALSQPGYASEDATLQSSALTTFCTELTAADASAKEIENLYFECEATCNVVFYAPINDLVNIAQSVQKYVRSIIAPENRLFEELSTLHFSSK